LPVETEISAPLVSANFCRNLASVMVGSTITALLDAHDASNAVHNAINKIFFTKPP
jgi:hypothetical protein